MRTLVICAAVLFLSLFIVGFVLACPANLVGYSNSTGWQNGTTVTIYLIGLDTAQQAGATTAFQNWNSGLGSGITFNTQVVGSVPANPTGTYAIVQFGNTSACGAGKSGCTTYSATGAVGYNTWATITIDPSLKTVDSIAPLLAHEVGHTYGFAECVACGSDVTIMDGSNITSSSPTGPLACDIQAYSQIRAGHFLTGPRWQRQWQRRR